LSSRITRPEVEHVAKLARLALTDAEIDALTGELDKILDHAAQVPSLDRAEVLGQAPAAEDDRFRVPRILGEAP
jgi:aspartyl-tRNA(Asn)/glutamyl-tRNA(Gln) amidotransferase subunit C